MRMTKPCYTHIIVPVELHSLLKSRASVANTSIAGYIRILEERSATESSRTFEPMIAGSKSRKDENPARSTEIFENST